MHCNSPRVTCLIYYAKCESYIPRWPCKLNCPNLFNPWIHWAHTSSTRFPSSSAQSSAQYPAKGSLSTAAAPEKVRNIISPGIVQTCLCNCINSKWSDIGNCNIGSISDMWCRIVSINGTVHGLQNVCQKMHDLYKSMCVCLCVCVCACGSSMVGTST